MGKYNSTEQRINIPLSEYQRLTLDSRLLARAIFDGYLSADRACELEIKLEKEDMNDE